MYDNEIYGTGTYENQGNGAPQFSEGTAQAAGAYQAAAGGKPPKKAGKIFAKLFLGMGIGLCFGIFAGVGFFAVQRVLGVPEEKPAISQNAPQASGDAGTANDSSPNMKISYVTSDVSDVVEEVMPAMVSIVSNYTETSSFWGRQYSREYEGSGTGIIVEKNDTELLMVSNYHVVANANQLQVTFINGKSAKAQIKGTDRSMDLAVISVALADIENDTMGAIHVATLGDSDSLKLGQPVIAIGNALGYGQSVTNGIVSALNREVTFSDGSSGTFIQTNAAINPGNSGGALLNIKGEVIGINSSKYMDVEVEGMGYAIPITSASPVVADLIEKQSREAVADQNKGYLGIEYEEVSSQMAAMFNIPQGIYVKAVESGSAAERAGIRAGDIIVEFDGEEVASRDDMPKIMQYYAAGDKVKLKLMRVENGAYVSKEVEAVLGNRP